MKHILVSALPFQSPPARNQLECLAKAHALEITYAHKKLSANEIDKAADSFDALIAGVEDFSLLFSRNTTPRLRYICKTGIGTDDIDFERAKALNIRVSHSPEAPSVAMAELALAMIQSLLRRLPTTGVNLQRGRWERLVGASLCEVEVGVWGLGRTGTRLAAALLLLGMKRVHYYDIRPHEACMHERLAFAAQFSGGRVCRADSPEELIEMSNVLSLHLPLYEATHHSLQAERLSLLKDKILVNCARGDLVDEVALRAHLPCLRGVGLDVFEKEPLSQDDPLYATLMAHPCALLSAHMGSCTTESREKMESTAVKSLEAFLEGREPPFPAYDEACFYAPYLNSL